MAKKLTRFPLHLPPPGQLPAENSDSVTKFRHRLGWEICNSFSPFLGVSGHPATLSSSCQFANLGGDVTASAAL